MKPLKFRFSTLIVTAILLVCCWLQVSSQMSIPRGSVKKGDTVVEYSEDRTKHVHEETAVIPVAKNKGAEQTASKGRGSAGRDSSAVGNNSNTSPDTSTSSVGSTTLNTENGSGTVTNDTTNTNMDKTMICMDKTVVYISLAVFGLLAIICIYLLARLLKDKKGS